MAIFGFKKRKDDKLEQGAEATKTSSKKIAAKGTASAKTAKKPAAKTTKPTKASKAKAAKPTMTTVPALASEIETSAASIIVRPHVTEKSGMLSQANIYTFVVSAGSSKGSVSNAIRALYKVTPIKIAIINTPAKSVFVRGKRGTVGGVKKAIVTLNKGDKIDFV